MATLEKPYPEWSEKAAELLLPYRNRDVVKSISISGERADHLEQKICEGLVEAFKAGLKASEW